MNSVCEADRFRLDVNSNVCFSVWVSFCEIYNDNIHDLLEQVRRRVFISAFVQPAQLMLDLFSSLTDITRGQCSVCLRT